jgi:hypothetical protein
MRGTSAQPNMTVLVGGNRIQAIGKDGKIRLPKDVLTNLAICLEAKRKAAGAGSSDLL